MFTNKLSVNIGGRRAKCRRPAPPLPFPRAPYTKPLVHHTALLERHKDEIVLELGGRAYEDVPRLPPADVAVFVAEWEAGAPPEVEAMHRAELATLLQDYRGILLRLIERPHGPWPYAVRARRRRSECARPRRSDLRAAR